MKTLEQVVEDLTPEQLSRIYMEVFNTDNGQLVLEDLKNRCHAEISTVSEGGIDPFQVVYKEGRRSVLLHIQTQLKPHEEAANKEE
jgi:hypothetical protein